MSDQNSLVKLSVDQFVRTTASSKRKKTAAQKLVKEYGPILDHFNDVVFIADEEGNFVFVNKAVSEQSNGVPSEVFIGRHFTELVDPKYHEFAKTNFQKVLSGEKIVPAIEMERQTESGEKITKEVNWKMFSVNNDETFVMGVSRDITDRKQAEEHRDKLIEELKKALSEVKTLQGFLPICSHCKKIRDDKGYWNQIESYIRDHTEAEFTHSICPKCAKKLYPDLAIESDNTNS